jgi:hypothetical protein
MRFRTGNTKRITVNSILLIVLTALTFSISFSAYAATSPKFKDIKLGANNVLAGNTVSVSVTIDANGTTATKGYVTWTSRSGRELHASLESSAKPGVLQGTIDIDKYAEPGKWKCSWVVLTDASGGYSVTDDNTDLSTADLVVENKTPDIAEPVFVSITVSPKYAKPGSTVTIKVKATDNLSGIESGFITWEKEKWSVSTGLSLDKKSGTLEGKALIPDEAEEGDIDVSSLEIADVAGNTFMYSSDSGFSEDDPDATISAKEDTTTLDEEPADVDLSAGAITVKGSIPKELITPPIIISPVNDGSTPFNISDQDPRTPGIQFEVRGLAVPSYGVKLISAGKEIAGTTAGFDGVWKIRVSTIKPIDSIYAISVMPNGLQSPAYTALTRALAAKLIVKLSNAEVSGNFTNAFTDVPANNPFMGYIEAAKGIGLTDPTNPDTFKPTTTISRGLFASWMETAMATVSTEVNGVSTEIPSAISPNVSSEFVYKRYFNDVDQAYRYAKSIQRGYENGWLNGNPDKMFYPESQITAFIKTAGIPEIRMSDIPGTAWYAPYIYDLAGQHVLNGTNGSLFRPNEKLTKGQLAKMLCLSKGWNAPAEATSSANQEIAANWWYPYLKILQEKGIVSADELNEISANKAATRAETAKMAVLAAGYKIDTTQALNADTIGHWAEQYILTAKKHSIISGYTDGLFRPDASITRAEAAKIVWRLRL